MKSICILSSLYPNTINPTSQVFVQQLAWAIADMGVECTIICPVAVNLHPRLRKLPESLTEISDNGALIKVFFPKFISFGQRTVFGIKTARLTTNLYFKAVERVWKQLEKKPEVVYGHFLTPAGICSSRLSKKYGIPSFAAFGESSPWSILNYGKEELKNEIEKLSGIVSVSTANESLLQNLDVFPVSKVKVFPNGIRMNRFYPHNRLLARAKFGFRQEDFIVAFLGSFSERKGVLRAAAAVNGLEGVKIAFAGSGPLQPNVSNCIYNGIVKPEDVPQFLSAADVFLLPTLNEGCCNAVVEAMSCGLPIISSDLEFNKDILNSENALLIDPNNIRQIREAVIHLRDNPAIRNSMGLASARIAKELTIEARAENIVRWVHQMI